MKQLRFFQRILSHSKIETNLINTMTIQASNSITHQRIYSRPIFHENVITKISKNWSSFQEFHLFSLLGSTKKISKQQKLLFRKEICTAGKFAKIISDFKLVKWYSLPRNYFILNLIRNNDYSFSHTKSELFPSTQFCCVFIRISSWFYFNEKWKFSQGHAKNSNWMKQNLVVSH